MFSLLLATRLKMRNERLATLLLCFLVCRFQNFVDLPMIILERLSIVLLTKVKPELSLTTTTRIGFELFYLRGVAMSVSRNGVGRIGMLKRICARDFLSLSTFGLFLSFSTMTIESTMTSMSAKEKRNSLLKFSLFLCRRTYGNACFIYSTTLALCLPPEIIFKALLLMPNRLTETA